MMNGSKGGLHLAAYWLMVIGGLNWGLIGLGGFFARNWNVVNLLLGRWPQVEWIVYIAVGVAAVKMCYFDMMKKKM